MDDGLRVEGLEKRFADQVVLAGVSLTAAAGEVLALLGPSGSGKTTLLRLLAGFERPDRGRVFFGGEDVTALPPARRRCGMVFQHYALFPHLDVEENVAFGLQGRGGLPPPARRERVGRMLALVGLDGFERRRIAQLSGGQQQRVALARALAPQPRLLLLDEPLSNLDPELRERTRRQLKASLGRVGLTTVLVTHEQEEAFHLGHRVAILHRGRLEQAGTPDELYERPATRFVAAFVGRSSAIAGRVVGPGEVAVGPEAALARWPAAGEAAPGEPVEVIVRPEALRFAAADAPGALPGRVVERRYSGGAAAYRVEVAAGVELEVAAGPRAAAEGDAVAVALAPEGPRPRLFRAPAAATGETG